ncbi:MAG: bifunctional alpha,alpha-trehalose-phosphate synthase (UDP-forming)/trehalose-phosphatase [Chryseolinea sp.]
MDELLQKRLILVSNRLPFQLIEREGEVSLKQSDGGLVTALKGYFEQQETSGLYRDKLWVGSADFPEKRWKKYKRQSSDTTFQIDALFINPKVYSKYYNGFCNATLWPLFHYFPSYVEYDQQAFEEYERVNRIFADHLLKIVKPGDTVWVHDYQLFMLPQMLRDKLKDATIGFFLHIPFPSYEIFRLLHKPWKEKIIKGILGADLVGFHTAEYVQHFLKSVRMVTGFDHQYRVIEFEDRLVKADLMPLGVDYERFNNGAHSLEVIQASDEIRKNFPDKKIIFSVDRLDYTKGITHRLSGYELLLETHPEWREKVVFVLVVVPSRQIISKYNERLKMIEEHVGSLNGKYSTLSWQPIIYRYNNLSFTELCALYRAADIALITPLRDGMNLVAKEFVASSSENGVLILSELAGAANEMGEALLVNPLDANEQASAINQALTMSMTEQRHRLSVMRKRLKEYDVLSWVSDFLTQLHEAKDQQKSEQKKFITAGIRQDMVNTYKMSNRRSLLLDYDGTLVPFARNPFEATPDQSLLHLLGEIGADPKNDLTIISGRDATILEEWFGKMPINLVAEHGAAIKRVGREWVQEKEIDQTWKPLIRPTLEMFMRRCPRSFVEEKNHTLAWHYRNVDSELGFIRSRELLDSLDHLIRNSQLQVVDGNKVIEIRVAGIDKGLAAKTILQGTTSDFILAMGDDKTDEDMFRSLADQAFTIKVGRGHSIAQYCIAHTHDVISLLQDFAHSNNDRTYAEKEIVDQL